jgi:hypothetical protein
MAPDKTNVTITKRREALKNQRIPGECMLGSRVNPVEVAGVAG